MADRVTVAEAAAILGVSEDVVRKRLQRGTLAGATFSQRKGVRHCRNLLQAGHGGNFGASATSDAPNTFSWYDIGKR